MIKMDTSNLNREIESDEAREGLTMEEKATNDDTWEHIHTIQRVLSTVIKELMDRQLTHDQSKLVGPEVQVLALHNEKKVKAITFNSREYNEGLSVLGEALEHHYYHNRHHPEHFDNGIEGMTLIDILEMVCDWKASSLRNHNGNAKDSVTACAKRFNIDKQLSQVLYNTIEFLEDNFDETRVRSQRVD